MKSSRRDGGCVVTLIVTEPSAAKGGTSLNGFKGRLRSFLWALLAYIL